MESGEGGADGDIESVTVRNFLAARVQEINSLSYQIGASGVPTSKGLAFQHVPKHMRRRAVSHNPKRLPKRLRGIHINQIEKSSGGTVSKKPKKPSRKHRRRKSNLLQEYNRRQRENKWLETHIWHAKRFFIENKWGYRIPTQPTDKGYRALYRAARDFTSMRDVSYLSCLELKGPVELISSTFSRFAPSAPNPLSVNAKLYCSGQREGSIYFYKANSYPYGYIGKVRFFWTSNQPNSSLMIWVHPTQKDIIIKEFCEEFELITMSKGDVEQMEIDGGSDSSVNINEIKLAPKNRQNRPEWTNPSTNINLRDLEGIVNRIRLYGPMSTEVLKEILQPLTEDKLTKGGHQWWQTYYSEEKSHILRDQTNIWNKLNDIQQVPYGVIIPLTVNDPRVLIPEKRTKSKLTIPIDTKTEDMDTSDCCTYGAEFSKILETFQRTISNCDSPLWNEKIRDALVKEKMSDCEFSKRRKKLLIPGSKIDLGPDENQIPIICLHRPSLKACGFQNGGWDLILPAGWAMSFWVALSYRAVRACGLRDASHYSFECGSTFATNDDEFPFPPDSHCGAQDDHDSSLQSQSDYFKYPPAKRSNFIKLKCPFPFLIQWDLLLQFLQPNSTSELFVLRDSLILNRLSNVLKSKQIDCTKVPEMLNCSLDFNRSLIGVSLKILGKGVIESGAVICIPQESDLKAAANIDELEEPQGDDSVSLDSRNKLYAKHQKFMSFMRSKRKKLRKTKDKDNLQKEAEFIHFDSTKTSLTYNEEMNRLWLPESSSVLTTMERTPIGIVIFGNESYSIGKCAGLGYCAGAGLLRWIIEAKQSWNPKSLILVRNCRNSLIYRWAKLEVCQLS